MPLTKYLVTKRAQRLLEHGGPVAVVNGTVPGWQPRPNDLHFDHQQPRGAQVQLDELPAIGSVPLLDALQQPACVVSAVLAGPI